MRPVLSFTTHFTMCRGELCKYLSTKSMLGPFIVELDKTPYTMPVEINVVLFPLIVLESQSTTYLKIIQRLVRRVQIKF